MRGHSRVRVPSWGVIGVAAGVYWGHSWVLLGLGLDSCCSPLFDTCQLVITQLLITVLLWFVASCISFSWLLFDCTAGHFTYNAIFTELLIRLIQF